MYVIILYKKIFTQTVANTTRVSDTFRRVYREKIVKSRPHPNVLLYPKRLLDVYKGHSVSIFQVYKVCTDIMFYIIIKKKNIWSDRHEFFLSSIVSRTLFGSFIRVSNIQEIERVYFFILKY